MASKRQIGFSRRNLLFAGASGAAAVALSACTRAPAPTAAGAVTTTLTASTPAAPTGSTPASTAGSSAAGSATPTNAAPPANAIAKLSDIAVGQAIATTDAGGGKIIVARPTASTVAAFSPVCTHQGCPVALAGQQLNCPCHGSVFSATTGAVLQGPAIRALEQVGVAISGGSVVTT